MNEIVNFGNGQRLKVVMLKGLTGENGRGIVSITKTSTLGRVDTYTILYTDGTTSTFDVTNGGGSGSQVDTVNGMTGNVVLTYADVGALPNTTQLKDLTQDSTHRTVTDSQITAWNDKVSAVNGQTGNVQLNASDVGALPSDTTLAQLPQSSAYRTVSDAEKTAWNNKVNLPTRNSTALGDCDSLFAVWQYCLQHRYDDLSVSIGVGVSIPIKSVFPIPSDAQTTYMSLRFMVNTLVESMPLPASYATSITCYLFGNSKEKMYVGELAKYMAVGAGGVMFSGWQRYENKGTNSPNIVGFINDYFSPTEDETTSSQQYAVGQYFVRNGLLCKAITTIASGETFTKNTNYAETNVGGELSAKQDLLSPRVTSNFTFTSDFSGVGTRGFKYGNVVEIRGQITNSTALTANQTYTVATFTGIDFDAYTTKMIMTKAGKRVQLDINENMQIGQKQITIYTCEAVAQWDTIYLAETMISV